MDIKKFFCVAVLAGLFACRGGEKVEQDVVSLTPVVSSSIEDVFSEVEILPLLFEEETYPSVAEEVVISDDYIFVSDRKKLIHVFDKEGHYISCSSKVRGGGPGEHDIVMGFSWNPYSQTIQVLTPYKLMKYDVNFKPIDQLALPSKYGDDDLNFFDKIYAVSKNKDLLMPANYVDNRDYTVYVFDNTTGELEAKLDYSADILVPITMQEQCFFKVGEDKLYFVAPAVTGEVFSISDDRLQKEITFSYDSDFITKADISKYDDDPLKRSDYLLECDKDIPVKVLPSDDKVLTYVKKSRKFRNFYAILTDLKSGENRRVNLYDGEQCQFPFANYADESGIYAIYDKEFLLDSPKLLLDKADKIDSIFADVEDESLIMLKYKF